MSEEAVKTVEYKDYSISIFPDEHCENPIQEWDVLGEYICWHRQYNIGNSNRFNNPQDVVEYAKQTNSMLFPLYMYDHSGISLSLSNSYYPFNCRWDAGQVGFVMVDREKALKEYCQKRLSKQLKQKIYNIIQGEVETYNQFLCGDVYGYVVNKDDEQLDSCWGYYGIDCCIDEAKTIVDYSYRQSSIICYNRVGIMNVIET